MFLCQLCGGVVPPRIPATRVVVNRRPKQYPFRFEANVFYRPDPKKEGKIKEHKTDDPGGVGWEIAREVLACPRCAAEFAPKCEEQAATPNTAQPRAALQLAIVGSDAPPSRQEGDRSDMTAQVS
jgi:hypothetical protein